MKPNKLMAMLGVLCVAFVLILSAAPRVDAVVDGGVEGDLYGTAAVWDYYYSDPHINSTHAAWLQNNGPRGVEYSWEFKSGLPSEGVDATRWATGWLRPNRAVFPSSNFSINLDMAGVERGQSYEWKLYTRMDVGRISWRVDVSTTVFHPEK